MNVTLMALRYRRGSVVGFWASSIRTLRRSERRVLILSACCVPMAVVGAIRLNNGAGDAVTVIALSVVVVTFAILWWRRNFIRDSVISVATYLLAATLLLATSLYAVGISPDTTSNANYRVFQLTKDHGIWNIGNFHGRVQCLPQHRRSANRDLAAGKSR